MSPLGRTVNEHEYLQKTLLDSDLTRFTGSRTMLDPHVTVECHFVDHIQLTLIARK